ncbi:MAG: TIR domain-containing protein [Chloroflexaceae bacterium]
MYTFLAYAPDNESSVAILARRLQDVAGVSFWFAPWHSIPGQPLQEQMEDALLTSHACAVFISGGNGISGWQTEQMRAAIQNRVEDSPGFRVIPVLLPGGTRPARRDLPPFLRRYELVQFPTLDDEPAFRRLLAGILGIAPAQVDSYLPAHSTSASVPASVSATGPTVAVTDTPERGELTRLRELLTTRFNEGELRTLCFDLGIDYDDLPGAGKADKARELVSYCARHARLVDLPARGRQVRPDISW